MIVRCENCGTEFGFDDRQVGEGVTVRCSVCKHVFTVESPSAAPQGWQIRTTDAMSFTAPDVATLREWIDEGRLHPDDQVSRTGRNWVRLGDMPEFSRAFSRFEGMTSVASPVREAEPPRAVPQPSPPVAAMQPVARVQLVPPQSQRPTLSPPRSAPPQEAAPVAAQRRPSAPPPVPARPVIPPSIAAPDEEIDLIIEDDDEDEVPTVAAIPAQRREASAPRVAEQPREASAPRREASAPRREASAPRREASAPHREASAPQSEAARQRSEPHPRPADPEPPELAEDDDLDGFESDSRKRRGVGPGLIAFLGVIAAVGLIFGIPDIRNKVLNLGQRPPTANPSEPAVAEARREIDAAERALEKLGTTALARAEADLQRALDAGGADPTTTAAMKVALADLLLSRSIAYQIAAALDADQRADFRGRAEDDQKDGKRIIDSLEGAPDVERLAEVRALARLAAGRAEVEVLPMVPDGALETKLIVEAAVLWHDLDAPVPSGLVAGLSGISRRSGLGESVLALALARAGDGVEARNVAERLLVGAEDQIVALAIRARLGSEPEPQTPETGETGEPAGETGGEDVPGEPGVAKAPPRPGEDDEASGGSGGSGFDRLVEKGCDQVAKGKAAEGVKTLLRAFDIKPNDLDVLVCLGDGYAAQGSSARAATFYNRALDQSPSNIPALRGAAKIAVKTGAEDRAKSLYERLLAADPNNAIAKAYLAKHAPKEDPPAEPEPPAQPADTGEG